MILWHIGAIVFLFRWIFADPKVDLRFLVGGAVLPDLIDLAAVTLLGGARGELWAHSLVVPSAVAVAILLATRRGRRRRAWMALVVAWLFHLLIDGMWTNGDVFAWPLFGFDLAVGGVTFWPGAWARALSDPVRWVLEAVGGAYLVMLFRRANLAEPGVRSRLWATGRID